MKLRSLCTLAFFTLCGAQLVNAQSCRDLYKEAKSLEKQGKLEKAKTKYRQVVSCGDKLLENFMKVINFRNTRLLYITIVFLYSPVVLFAQSSADVQAYIAKYRDLALEQENRYGVPASITLAQGILESGAGKSMLTRNANNHFGVKAYGGWTGPVYLAWDDEKKKSRFRSYSSAMESYRDHSLFLKNNSRYNSLFTKSVYDYRAWAIGLQKAGYATSGTYAKALIGLVDAYRLYAINGGVKLKAGKTVTITKVITSEIPVDLDCQMDESEESKEEKEVKDIIKRFVVEINDVRCTILYPGESLASISQKYDIPQYKILEFNEISDESSLNEGDIVYLQKKKKKYTGIQDCYRVKDDDTLYGISQQFGIMMSSLARMNNKDMFSRLQEGERLMLK